MSNPKIPAVLGQISTVWSMVMRANAGSQAQPEALLDFFQRYQGAVLRYFQTALKDDETARDLTQDFALRFVRGDFWNVAPERGRFRDFLRVSLANMLRDHRRRQKHRVGAEFVPGIHDPVNDDSDHSYPEFDESWRNELLSRCWIALEQHQTTTGEPYYTALKLKADRTAVSSAELAESFNAARAESQPISEPAFRKTLQRARDRFGELLLREVAETLAVPTRAELERELIELRLLSFCGSLLPKTDGR